MRVLRVAALSCRSLHSSETADSFVFPDQDRAYYAAAKIVRARAIRSKEAALTCARTCLSIGCSKTELSLETGRFPLARFSERPTGGRRLQQIGGALNAAAPSVLL